MKTIFPMILAAFALTAPAKANDSTAEHAAGGLVLTKSPDIDMVSEDLFVSADEIRVRYVFRNRSKNEIRTAVAFPMPNRDLAAERESDVAYPTRFETKVDGRPVAMEVQHRALVGNVDYTMLLGSHSLLPTSDGAALAGVPKFSTDRLVKLGLAVPDGSGPGLVPNWTVAETWYWVQVFPAGKDLVVEHRYVPGTGGSVDAALAWPDFRKSPEGRAMIGRYCADSAFLAGLDRLRRSGGPTPEQRLGYILSTGANWRSPITDFRMVIDKGAAANLVSFCGEGVRKISPTRFEIRRKNWRPDKDLEILIVRPQPKG